MICKLILNELSRVAAKASATDPYNYIIDESTQTRFLAFFLHRSEFAYVHMRAFFAVQLQQLLMKSWCQAVWTRTRRAMIKEAHLMDGAPDLLSCFWQILLT